jgi:hypothetical protein
VALEVLEMLFGVVNTHCFDNEAVVTLVLTNRFRFASGVESVKSDLSRLLLLFHVMCCRAIYFFFPLLTISPIALLL